jgi:2-polyprenyl-3-methyl-5-hydroxy-6-metoxy-1,4-benzoquinol methylase
MPAESATHKFLVHVVAGRADGRPVEVFERVPRTLFNHADVHFLVSADDDGDDGSQELAAWLTAHGIRNVTVLQTGVQQGYGGNQKLGCRIAVDRGFDCLILLPADDPGATDLLPRFMQLWEMSRADVLLGSRTPSARSARRGVSWRRAAGSRILTWFQNRLTGLALSGHQTGYRACATEFLERVPFETNTNDVHFDTEILLQAVHVGARIVETPFPAQAGSPLPCVSGLRHAANIVAATVQYKLHQFGLLCSLKLRDLSPRRYRDKTRTLYSSHALALRLVEQLGAERVLDLGCGPGHVAAECRQRGLAVTGVDLFPPEPGAVDRFVPADLDRGPLPVRLSDYDVTLLLDVIEHLSDPEAFLLSLRNQDRPAHVRREPRLLISTPNVAFAAVRLNLLLGQFNYAERGILDITHKRLFTRRTLLRALRDCGYVVDACHPVGVPFEAVLGGRGGRVLGRAAAFLARIWPTLFAFQFLVVCRARPGVAQVLAEALRVHAEESAAKNIAAVH